MKIAALFVTGTLGFTACTFTDASSLPIPNGPPPTTSTAEVMVASGGGPLTASVQPQARGRQADRKISDAVRAQIMADPQLAQVPLDRVRIETEKGKVTVAGVMATDAQHKALVAKVKTTEGVLSVDDQVEVLPTIK